MEKNHLCWEWLWNVLNIKAGGSYDYHSEIADTKQL